MLLTLLRRAIVPAVLALTGGLVAPFHAEAVQDPPDSQDLVGVALLDDGQGVLLATPGRAQSGRKFRFRSLDTSALPQPLSRPVLSASGTKLFLQDPAGSALVVDLTIQHQASEILQYVDLRDVAINGSGGRHTHRLPSQRFVALRAGSADVVDDVGAVQPQSPPLTRKTNVNDEADGETASGAWLDSLRREALTHDGARGRRLGDWELFRITPDPELYVPVLEVAKDERVFPGRFETLERLGPHSLPTSELFRRYLRQDLEVRRKNCTIYYRVLSDPGTFTIEYWLYYAFDVGGLKGHLHDPEHVFVEVDKLGGVVHKVIADAHGFLAGNNIYTTTRPAARPAALPLFVMVELDKHATAPDMNRDGAFTPGIDENEYRERAEIWGVRDVMGTNNNHLLPYDDSMTLPRSPRDYLASVNILNRFPHEQGLADRACCRLIPLPVDSPRRTTCLVPTAECAMASVTLHPDFLNRTTIMKEWISPQSFLRATYVAGPGLGAHSVGLGYSIDLDRAPLLRALLPLPGRIGVEAFAWKHEDLRPATPELPSVRSGIGIGGHYEQFFSNLFGIHSGIRAYSPPISKLYVTFGPMVEIPIRNSGNVNFVPGLSLVPGGSPQFEMRISVGFWKRRVAAVGIAAGK